LVGVLDGSVLLTFVVDRCLVEIRQETEVTTELVNDDAFRS
jgi:hypothetical protein